MSTPNKPDDLEAVRAIVAALQPFDAELQERILRWAREKADLPTPEAGASGTIDRGVGGQQIVAPSGATTGLESKRSGQNIKEFIAAKNPTTANQFAAAVAYFYRFEAPEASRKAAITQEDLQEACRLAGKHRLTKPAQTLINAHSTGYLDKTTDRGAYSISTVGENLIAMTLPGASTSAPARRKKQRSGGAKPKKAKKGSR